MCSSTRSGRNIHSVKTGGLSDRFCLSSCLSLHCLLFLCLLLSPLFLSLSLPSLPLLEPNFSQRRVIITVFSFDKIPPGHPPG